MDTCAFALWAATLCPVVAIQTTFYVWLWRDSRRKRNDWYCPH